MPTNQESLNRELFRLLSKYKPKPLDAEGKATPVPDEADIFKFEFTKDGEEYGTVYVTLDEDRVLTVYFGDDVSDSPGDKTPGLDYDDTWSGLLHQLSAWRMTKGLRGFKTQNKDRVGDDMARRNHMRNKDKIAEGYYPMGKRASYSDAVPSVKIVIEHSRTIEEGEQRYRNINRIFLENQAGERYLLDTKKPGIARVYARHIAEGGRVNDDRWDHIGSLCEEYSKMAGFVRATRNGQFNESAQALVNEGLEHYQSLRESLSRMTGKRGYNAYFESWTPSLMETEGEENNLNELFVQETLDPRIESVMPILNRIHKKVSESTIDKEMNKLAEWADSLTEAEGESLTSNNPIGIPESLDQHSPVTQAITRRILMQHPDLLQKYGPEKIGDAIDSVAEFVGDVEEIGSSDVSGWVKQVAQSLGGIAEGKGDFSQAIEQLSGWDEVSPDEPGTRQYHFDDDEGGYYAQGTVVQDLKTGQIKIEFKDDGEYGGHEINDTFNSIGDAMNALRNITTRRSKSGRAQNFDTLGSKTLAGPDDVYKTDRAGKIGTLTKSRMGGMKASSQHTMRGGPKGVLPEEEMDESALQAYLGDKKYGKDGMDALRKAGREHAGKEKMQSIRAKFSDKEEDVSEGYGDFGEEYEDMADRELVRFAHMLGLGKYPKEDENGELINRREIIRMLQSQAHDEDVEEGLDANQKRVGQLGPTEKVKNNNIGKLVGANENFINTVDQAVVSEDEDRPYVCVHAKKGKCEVKASSSYQAAQKAAQKWGLKGTAGIDAHLADVEHDASTLEEMDKSEDKKGPEGKATPITPNKMADDAKNILDKAASKEHKKEVKEGQDELDRILTIMNHRR